MHYCVLRFKLRNKTEQWIVPKMNLVRYTNMLSQIVIPVPVSQDTGQIHRVLFVNNRTRLRATVGFLDRATFLLYTPSITPSESVLVKLTEFLRANNYGKRVTAAPDLDMAIHRSL